MIKKQKKADEQIPNGVKKPISYRLLCRRTEIFEKYCCSQNYYPLNHFFFHLVPDSPEFTLHINQSWIHVASLF